MRKNVTAVRGWGKRECNEKGARPLEGTCAQKKKHEIRGLSPDFVIVSPKNFHQRVLQFSDALPSALSVYKLPCSEAA